MTHATTRMTRLLAQYRRQRKMRSLQLAMLWGIGFLLGTALLLVLGETLFRFSPDVRTPLYILMATLLVVGVLALPVYLLFNLGLRRTHPDDITLAADMGTKDPAIKDRLRNVLELQQDGQEQLFSESLIRYALEQVAPLVPDDTRSFLTAEPRRRALRFLAVILVMQVLYLIPGLQHGLQRFLQPGEDFSWQVSVPVHSITGDTTLVRGEPLEIDLQIESDRIPADLKLSVAYTDEPVRFYPLATRGQRLYHMIPAVSTPFTYQVTGQDVSSRRHRVEVLDRPIVTRFQVTLTFPEYTELQPLILDPNLGSFTCVAGTEMELTLEASKQLQQAILVLSDSIRIPLSASDTGYHYTQQLWDDGTWHLELLDRDDLTNRDPVEYRFQVTPDQPPLLLVTSPRTGGQVNQLIDVRGTAMDDFGVSGLTMHYRFLSDFLQSMYEDFDLTTASKHELSQWEHLHIPFDTLPTRETIFAYPWDLTTTDVLPDDEILLYLEVTDNRRGTGRPQTTRSPLIRLNVPGTEELYEEIQSSEVEEIAAAEELIKRTREHQDKLDELMKKVETTPEEITWEDRKQLEQMVQEQDLMRQEAAKRGEELAELQKSMEENHLFDPEVMKQFEEVTRMLQDMLTEEMKELLKKLKPKNDQPPSPEQLQAAMEQMDENLDKYLEQLEQLKTVLEQLRLEQKLQELARVAQELREEQDRINKEMAADSTQAAENAPREQRLSQRTKDLQESIEAARQEFQDNPHMPAAMLSQAGQMMQDQQLSQRMQQMSMQMQQGAPSQAEGSRLSSQLMDLENMLQQASEQASQSAQDDLSAAISEAIRHLLLISGEAEKQESNVTNLHSENSRLSEYAQNQLTLSRALAHSQQEVEELILQSFFINRMTATQIEQARIISDKALASFEERQLHLLPKSQKQIRGYANRAAWQLLQDQQSMQQSSSSTGFEEMMQQLMQAASQQQCLNGNCKKLMSVRPGGKPKPMGINFNDMARQQGQLRQKMESLSSQLQQMEEQTGGKKPLGDLGEVAGDMKKVEEQLKNRQYTEREKRLQERILTRLLDAQKSIHEKDRDKKRKSRTGEYTEHESPDQLQPLDTHDEIRQRLIEALQEGYSHEYQDLVRRYFQSLENPDDD